MSVLMAHYYQQAHHYKGEKSGSLYCDKKSRMAAKTLMTLVTFRSTGSQASETQRLHL